MAKEKELRIIVRIRDQANRTLGKISKTLRGFGKIAKIGAVAMAALSAAAVYLGAKMVALSNEQEKAETKLRAVIGSMGRFRQSADTLVPALLDTASAIQEMGIASDHAVISGTAMLATYQQISDEQLPRAMEVMADISALMEGDMRNAANMLGKAALGMTGELRRAGITIDDATAKSGDFSLILEAIAEQIGDQNQALRRTGYGGLVAFSNQMGDTMEIGGKFIKGLLGPIAEAAARSLSKINAQLREFIDSDKFTAWARETIPIIAAGFNVIIKIIGGAVRAGLAFLGTMTEIANVARQIAIGYQTIKLDKLQKEHKELTELQKINTQQMKAYFKGLEQGIAATPPEPIFTAEHEARLRTVNSELRAGMATTVGLAGAVADANDFINQMADAYTFVGEVTDNVSEDFMKNVEQIVTNLDKYDLTAGGPQAPGVPGAPDPDEAAKALEAAQAAMDSITDVYKQAQLDIIEATEGAGARAQEEFTRRMTELQMMADQAIAQGIMTQQQWQEQQAIIQQAHDLRMEEMNRTHWQQILADTEATTQLMNQNIENFSQGATDAFADWMSDTILGIKRGEGAMLKAMGGLIGGIAQQWGDYYVAKGIATIAEAFSTFPAVNTGMLTAGTKLVAAGTALKALGALLGKAGGGAEVGAGGGGAGAGAGAVPGQGALEPQRGATIVVDVGELREEDIVTDIPGFMTRVIDELNDAFERNVEVKVTGGE